MASGPITSWEIDGETVETVSDFIFWGSKIKFFLLYYPQHVVPIFRVIIWCNVAARTPTFTSVFQARSRIIESRAQRPMPALCNSLESFL